MVKLEGLTGSTPPNWTFHCEEGDSIEVQSRSGYSGRSTSVKGEAHRLIEGLKVEVVCEKKPGPSAVETVPRWLTKRERTGVVRVRLTRESVEERLQLGDAGDCAAESRIRWRHGRRRPARLCKGYRREDLGQRRDRGNGWRDTVTDLGNVGYRLIRDFFGDGDVVLGEEIPRPAGALIDGDASEPGMDLWAPPSQQKPGEEADHAD